MNHLDKLISFDEDVVKVFKQLLGKYDPAGILINEAGSFEDAYNLVLSRIIQWPSKSNITWTTILGRQTSWTISEIKKEQGKQIRDFNTLISLRQSTYYYDSHHDPNSIVALKKYLTERQYEYISLVHRGLESKEIQIELGISKQRAEQIRNEIRNRIPKEKVIELLGI